MLDSTRLRTELSDIEDLLEKVAANNNGLVGHLRQTGPADASSKLLIWQALHADCLRIAYTAVAADGEVTETEIEDLYEYPFTVAKMYSKIVSGYGDFEVIDLDRARDFLRQYDRDDGPFGFQCSPAGRWMGLDLCRRAAQLGQGTAIELYEKMVGWLTGEALQVGRIQPSDPRWGVRLAQIQELRAALEKRSQVFNPAVDLRAQAFCQGDRVFASVAHASAVFENDPFDVETVEEHARDVFDGLVDRAGTPSGGAERGRMLLILGDAGAGKTHLLRAFRQRVHHEGTGFVAYAQLQSQSQDYSRYLLSHLIDSLDRPYATPPRDRTGLLELACGLPELAPPPLAAQIRRLGEELWPDRQALGNHVNQLVDDLLRIPDLGPFDPDLLRVFLYLLRRDASITAKVVKYLRCEPLNLHDRSQIGEVEARLDEDAPVRMIGGLARLAFRTRQAALVLMVDQAELTGFSLDNTASFRRAVDVLHRVVSEVPSAVAVISCLEDLWFKVKPELGRSALDRLERDPPSVRLTINRSYAEIKEIVARRLASLYESRGATVRADDPTFPIPESGLRELENRRTRDVLDSCHRFQEACAEAGEIVADWRGWRTGGAPPPPKVDAVGVAWNEHLHAKVHEVPTEEEQILALINDAAKACELESESLKVSVKERDGTSLIDLSAPQEARSVAIGVANRSYHAGAFSNQVDAICKAAGKKRVAVIVRTSEFPAGAASAAKLAGVLKAGGRKVQLQTSDLRTLVAMQTFSPAQDPELVARWRRRDRPLTGQPAIAALFDLPGLVGAAPTPKPSPPPAEKAAVMKPPPEPAPAVPPPPPADVKPADHSLHVGVTVGFRPEPVRVETQVFLRHAGILGTTGSGKTTLALNLIEQLLLQDIAVVLLDRKGDLAGYARPGWWTVITDPERRRRAQALAERLDVRLFTPGTRGGRPVGFAVAPSLEGVPEHDRSRAIQYAASALAAMIRLGEGAKDQARRAILAQGIAALAERKVPASLEDLLGLIESRDDDLVSRAGRFDDKLFTSLVTDLETFRLNDGELFDRGAEQLSAELLLGRAPGGRTPLSIVSTKFLGTDDRVQAWAAQLFVELGRWSARSPRASLQAVLLVDEADLYMPAGASKPPSKEPLQDLLKRARSGGLGVMLATQSPGDLDYRSREQINSWFAGRVERRSIDKLKPLFEKKPAAAGKIGDLRPGHFVALLGDKIAEIERTPSMLVTEQIPDMQILELASAGRRSR